ncbi:HEAT repeat domain-containing protein [Actinomadura scrupuli]|uniref:HEAT repeat domain-containing protein n=1 Tax=Actinomadura scrupuli TaxID=559629 RepID=UPI003D97E184
MALLIHVTPAKNARRIRRSGIAAASHHRRSEETGVYCAPVLQSYTLSYQWLRELRRSGQRTFVAVHFRIDDHEQVLVGHYGASDPRRVTAAQAIALIRAVADPRGYEIFVPRAVNPAELHRVRRVSQVTGWRYVPGAHGTRPCSCPVCLVPGTYQAADIRARYPLDPPPRGKPELMAALRAADLPISIVEALQELGGAGRRWGGAEELAGLAGHPDVRVREALAETLHGYRGRAAQDLLERLRSDPHPLVREAASP